jgi:hypothetical protein
VLVIANFSSSLIHFTLMMEAILYSVKSILTNATRFHIPEDGIFHANHAW